MCDMSNHQLTTKKSIPGNLKNRGFKSKSMDTSSSRKPCPCLCGEIGCQTHSQQEWPILERKQNLSEKLK
jgi:hypothetical protein